MKRITTVLVCLLALASIALARVVPVPPSTALESSRVLLKNNGVVLGFQVNTTSVAVWVMLFDLSSVPADGAVTPLKWYQVPANQTLGVSWTLDSMGVNNGAVLVCSSTGPFTKTASATCTFSGEVQGQ
jgi:hypothetical protein